MRETLALIILIAFIMVACDPQGTGDGIRSFIDAASGADQ